MGAQFCGVKKKNQMQQTTSQESVPNPTWTAENLLARQKTATFNEPWPSFQPLKINLGGNGGNLMDFVVKFPVKGLVKFPVKFRWIFLSSKCNRRKIRRPFAAYFTAYPNKLRQHICQQTSSTLNFAKQIPPAYHPCVVYFATFPTFYHKNQPNVAKYTIHGS